MADFVLPDLVTLNDFEGNWDDFYAHIYECFRDDFIVNPLTAFQKKRIGLKRHPLTVGKEATFYHITHEGTNESERTPDLRRMERIRWVRYMIENCENENLKMWRNKRGTEEYILIYHESQGYLVVLADRGNYVLPWTAYCVTYRNRQESLLKEYQAYVKAEAAK